jgi:uncharacterized protein (DUF1800 family)
MISLKRIPVSATMLLAAAVATAIGTASSKNKPQTIADEWHRAVHAVDRLTFGAQPGEVDAVAAMGVDRWIDLQLHPDQIPDTALHSRLAQYRTLQMSSREVAANFPPNPLLKAAMEGKVPIPSEPYRRAIYQAGIVRLESRQDEKQATSAASSANDGKTMLASVSDTQSAAPKPEKNVVPDRNSNHELVDSLVTLPPDVRMQRILSLSPAEQAGLMKGLAGGKKQALLAGLNPQQRETVVALDNPQALVNYEAQSGKLMRAVYGDRQLEEVLTDFWFNHFNVYLNKGADRYLVTAYERDVIRPHILGKFQDLLLATAQSPAMLFYLDNWQSEGPNSPAATGQTPPKAQARRVNGPFGPHPVVHTTPKPQAANANPPKKRGGLNENYARELMELHTLGVNGGYTQKDVTEVARVFTGWTLQDPRDGGGFVFKEKLHEPGTKTVLGHKIKENGEKEGLQVLQILAHHPSTAHFLSLELAQRFVSDDPPPQLVDQMAKTFLKTNGDLREVMRTMLSSPLFWAPETYRAKVKTPFEFVVSSLRATDADITETAPLLQKLNAMGMPIYGMQPPTGYSTKAETWVNSSALLDRMNFALALVNNKIPGTHFDPAALLPNTTQPIASADPVALQARLEQVLLSGEVSAQTHTTISHQAEGAGESKVTSAPNTLSTNTVALLLGSPEFQRR